MILNEEQQMLADLAERMVADSATVDTLRAIRAGEQATDHDQPLWQTMVDSGLSGILVPETHGGMAFGLVGAGLVARALGKRLALTPFLSNAVLGVTAITTAASAEQQSEWLPAIVAGDTRVALASDEGGKHRPERIETRATHNDGSYAISGHKTRVIDAGHANLLIVSALDDGTPRLFAVETDAAGVTVEPTASIDTRSMADVRFEQAQGQRLDAGEAALHDVLDAGRAVLAMELIGVSQGVFERTLAYLGERKQFGQAIGAFQALQHRAAHLQVEIEISQAMVFQALAALDERAPDASRQVLAAKARAADTARLASAEGVQMHGGMGMTDEFDIGFFMKRAHVASELMGDANFCAERFARSRGY